jgi:hypothetical protein
VTGYDEMVASGDWFGVCVLVCLVSFVCGFLVSRLS